MHLELYTSAFCEPCMQTRAIVAEAARLVPGLQVSEIDVAFRADAAEAEGIRSTPTVIVRAPDGTAVFRSAGVPTLPQVLLAVSKAI